MKALSEYYSEKIETMDLKELEETIQLPKLMRQLEYVFSNSAFYQKKFHNAGVQLSDIKTLADLGKLPFTQKGEIRETQQISPPLGEHMACTWNQVRRIYSSSGTSGRPTFIGITHHDYDDVWMQIASRSHFCNGFRPGDQVIVTVNMGPFVAGSELDAFEKIGCTSIPLPHGNTERVIMAFRNGANAIIATPSYIQYLMRWCHEKEIDTRSLGLRKITLSGEPGVGIPSVREKVRSSFNAEVTETAGISEIAVSIWGECSYNCGMHFCAQEFVIVELIDPETGEVLEFKDGATGELVYTAIDRECVPLIRYRSRDHVQVWTAKCDCGRTSPRIRIIGRTDDMMIIKGVNVFPSAIKSIITEFKPKTTGEMLIQLKQPGPVAKAPLPIKVEYASGMTNLNQLKDDIEAALRSKLVFKAEIELVPEGVLPKSEYKTNLIQKLYEE